MGAWRAPRRHDMAAPPWRSEAAVPDWMPGAAAGSNRDAQNAGSPMASMQVTEMRENRPGHDQWFDR